MDAERAPRRFPIGLTVATVVSLVILCTLGAWQLQRLAWKKALLARVAALEHASPIPLPEALQRASRGLDVDMVRVTADCPALGRAPFVQLYALEGGEAGSRLVSVCPVGAGSVLVDRGFVADTISARPPVDGAGAPVRLTGVLRRPDPANFVTPPQKGAGQFYWRDVQGMARILKAPSPAAYMLVAETSTNPEWQALKPIATPKEIPNRHLEYALTWFGLAGALLAVYAAMVLRRVKGPAS